MENDNNERERIEELEDEVINLKAKIKELESKLKKKTNPLMVPGSWGIK